MVAGHKLKNSGNKTVGTKTKNTKDTHMSVFFYDLIFNDNAKLSNIKQKEW